MAIRRTPRWALPESAATPESVYLDRRRLMLAAGVAVGGAILPRGIALAQAEDPSAGLYPAPRNDAFEIDREVTPERFNLRYNNFYEFGSHKEIAQAAQALAIRPWQVVIDGDVEEETVLDVDDLLARVELEERVYRLRCVEAWAMAIPWTGFPFSRLLDIARPLSRARYVRMETFEDADMAPGQRQFWYPWPYVEGLTMAEAANELAFLVTGAYGKPVAKQMGAPLRLAVPWKYGFKSVKSIVRFTFTDERPVNFWQEIQPQEYGFWANVNPEVPHPRWSQAEERVLGTERTVPTQLYNGYAEEVAGLYDGLGENERLFM